MQLVLLCPNVFSWWSTWADQGAHRGGGVEVLYLFIRNSTAMSFHHNEGVLCIICAVAGSDAIKWSPDAMCTATASSQSAQPTTIWQQVVFFAIVAVLPFFFRVCSGMWMIHLVGCYSPPLGAAPPPPPRPPRLCVFWMSAKSFFSDGHLKSKIDSDFLTSLNVRITFFLDFWFCWN